MRRLSLFSSLLVAAVVATASCKHEGAPADVKVSVAAAADLALAFRDVGEAWEKAGHGKPTLTFGSTGLLAKQVIEGAPYDVFAAANVNFVDDVVKNAHCDPKSQTLYARGRIVVWSREGGNVAVPKTLAELTDSRFKRIAIANPEHAPYGRAAQEALTSLGVWETVKPKLVYGENVQQTLQFAQTGNADAAIVALSLATVSGGTSLAIDADLHKPIDQALVVCAKGPRAEEARAFVGFVGSPEGRAIMRRYGFLLPGEAVAR